ncbi:hypothetical protein ATCC90586_000411 [Pythium insidiosum]|nr:hypothetical protein ATCC90586_000411 [Pythium insidiosum]
MTAFRLQALVTLLAIASTLRTVCFARAHVTPPAYSWPGNASSPPSLDRMPRSARIAIIGGGVSGVSAAETLVKHGFTNVVVFEAGSTIVPIQHALYGSIVLVTYPLLTLIQMATQWECFRVQLGLSTTYWSMVEASPSEEKHPRTSYPASHTEPLLLRVTGN